MNAEPTDPPAENSRLLSCEWLFEALSDLGNGAILIGKGGEAILANDEARRHFGSAIAIAGTQIFATDPASNVALQDLIQSLKTRNAEPSRQRIALVRADESPLVAYAIPVNRLSREIRGAVGILVIVDPHERVPTAPLLQQLFGLTAAEARLASGLVKGADLHEIAEEYSLSVETLRVQLKSIFAKTHTRRQAELVALLAKLSV